MAITIDWVLETAPIGFYVARITGNDNDTVEIPLKIQAAEFRANRDEATTDKAGVTFTAGSGTVTLRLAGTTSAVSGTLIALGDV